MLRARVRASRRRSPRGYEGTTYELDRGWLAGGTIEVSWSALDDRPVPWAEYEGKRYDLHVVDPTRNASRARPQRHETPETPEREVVFDPPKALLDRAVGRNPQKDSAQ